MLIELSSFAIQGFVLSRLGDTFKAYDCENLTEHKKHKYIKECESFQVTYNVDKHGCDVWEAVEYP